MTRDHWPSVAGCIYSDDHGITWHAGAMTEGIQDANETGIAEFSDGRVLLNIRNRNEYRHQMLGISSDGGQTIDQYWTPDALIDPMCFGSLAATPDGGVLFANCDSQEKRVSLTVKASVDQGRTWKVVWDVDPMSGYANIAVANGHVYVFYERMSYEHHIIEELVLAVGEIVNEE